MAYLSGLFLIDCPASALNNAGQQGEMVNSERRYDNWSAFKYVRVRNGIVPYVSAQAFRYWLRDTLKGIEGWTPSPTFKEEKIAYTDANPILYAEDDLFGYMRAPGSSKGTQKEKWEAKGLTDQEKAKDSYVTLTRSSPFRVSTLVAIAPLRQSEIGFDYGVMARTEDAEYPNPVPYVHEFYRTTLVGQFSIDLRMMGRFYSVNRTGYRHLDEIRKDLAIQRKLKPYDSGRAFELDLDVRKARLSILLEGLARISGGAKQSLHYTDISPRFVILGVGTGGNHLFGTLVNADKNTEPVINRRSLAEVSSVFHTELLSKFYAGMAQGYLDSQRDEINKTLEQLLCGPLDHPVEAIQRIKDDLDKDENAEKWLA
jgi:CRISPR-associated protein Cst2